jgi:hypothetical protein
MSKRVAPDDTEVGIGSGNRPSGDAEAADRPLIDFLEVTVGSGPQHFARDLEVLGRKYSETGFLRFRGLEALAFIAQHKMWEAGQPEHGVPEGAENYDGVPFDDDVSVPWWAVRASAIAWRDFKEQVEQKVPTSLGRCFETESGVAGVRSGLTVDNVDFKNREFARLVAWLRFSVGPSLSVEKAIEVALGAPGFARSERSAWEAWTAFGTEYVGKFEALRNSTPVASVPG